MSSRKCAYERFTIISHILPYVSDKNKRCTIINKISVERGISRQTINNSGISLGMVGTPESTKFFEQALQLARRSLGLNYGVLEYNQYFYDFCKTLFKYQYTKHKTDISDSIVRWLYEHSGGILSIVVSLIHDSQEISILNGSEILNLEALNEAYKKRLTMLHGYIDPTITRKKQTSKQNHQAYEYRNINENNECEDLLFGNICYYIG